MGFHYQWSDENDGVVEINGFNLDDDIKGRVDIKKLIRLVNSIVKDIDSDYETSDVFDILIHEIVQIPDDNGVYETDF